MQTHVFLIRALTNLHVGSGDANYGAVDKLVQRDPATNLPTIHSTSIKGAIREHFEEVVGWKHAQHPKKAEEKIEHIFGSAVGDSDNAKQGNYHFFSADLLGLAVPEELENSTDTFFRASSEKCLGDFFNKAKLLGGLTQMAQLKVGLTGNEMAVREINTLKDMAEALPVIARNQLENGVSNNLWYEELVPRESVFGWLVQSNGSHETEFISELDGKIIQIGANATVGYGFCFFKKIN